MTLNYRAQRAIIAAFFFALTALYLLAWFLPAIGLAHDDAAYLLAAKSLASGHTPTQFPPFFPAVLALFTLVSQQTQWLKLLPLACAVAWLLVTRKLLLKMGASRNGALLLIGLTAASPTVVFLSTNLLPETLFALLVMAALLTLLEERALLSGLFAGLATLTQTAGAALIAACILTLVVRRRFRAAAIFAAVAMAMVAPWYGWSLAQINHSAGIYVASNIFTGLAASEKLIVLSRNLVYLLASPFSLLTGLTNALSVIATVVILLWCFIVRRQLVPDLFVVFYGCALLCLIAFPEPFVAPVLPLVLWIVWRVFNRIKVREAVVALVLIIAVIPFWADATRLLNARATGYFDPNGKSPDNWHDMQKLFAFIRNGTPPDSILLANMDGAFFLNTGRNTTRGFVPNPFDMFYAARQTAVTPDRLSKAIEQSQVAYVVLTPDRDLAESPSFHKSVEALERGGIIEPVPVPGVPRDYQLFHVVR